MNYEVAKECTILSSKEQISFPEVVHRLSQAGIESYYADLLSSTKTYYAGNIAFTDDIKLNFKAEVSDTFRTEDVINAIRQIQLEEIQYQTFLKKIMDSGVIGYFVFIKGHKAIYFGRKGEYHIEEFPNKNK